MEIVVFLAMMLVPFVSIAALIIALLAKKQVSNLKALTIRMIGRKSERTSEQQQALDEFLVSEM